MPRHFVVDDRECRSEVYALLASQCGASLEVKRLTVGDYEIGNEWVFERKTVPDFATSLVDGRLFSQAYRLANCSGGRALIVEGSDEAIGISGVSRESWQGALVSLGLAFHLPILRSADARETVQLLIYASQQHQRQREAVFIPIGRRPRSLERQRLRVLVALPGIGRRRAGLLLQHFGSIEAVVLADEEELMAVPGIGRATAQEIRRLVS